MISPSQPYASVITKVIVSKISSVKRVVGKLEAVIKD